MFSGMPDELVILREVAHCIKAWIFNPRFKVLQESGFDSVAQPVLPLLFSGTCEGCERAPTASRSAQSALDVIIESAGLRSFSSYDVSRILLQPCQKARADEG
jgi:hypothetical protein